MRKRFHVTYDIVTPDSAIIGDAAERGFVMPGDWHYSTDDSPVGPDFVPIKAEHALTLREAAELAYPQEDSGSWFSEVDGRDDYRTGANETRSIHPPDNITPASYGRLRRLFRVAA